MWANTRVLRFSYELDKCFSYMDHIVTCIILSISYIFLKESWYFSVGYNRKVQFKLINILFSKVTTHNEFRFIILIRNAFIAEMRRAKKYDNLILWNKWSQHNIILMIISKKCWMDWSFLFSEWRRNFFSSKS